jgi:hypothetical protein
VTIEVWTELVCAKCAATIVGQFSFNGQIAVRKLKKAGEKAGALFYKEETFCSERCLKEQKQETGE